MEWILEKLPVLIFVVVFLAQIVRGFMRSRGSQAEPPPRHDHMEEQRRTREIQAEIRRKVAERRAGREPTSTETERPVVQQPAPPVVRRDPTAIPLPDPLGGPFRRMLEELEKKAQPASVPAPPVLATSSERRNAEMERQQELAEQLRSLEESRVLAQRRAARIVASKERDANSEAGLRTAARGQLLDDLRDPGSLRRAFVLREVLGPPFALR